MRRREDSALPVETLLVFLRSHPVQTILKWFQDGSHHPRFDDNDLLNIPRARSICEAAPTINALINSVLTARHRARTLLAAAQRAVEIAIERSEGEALASLSVTSGMSSTEEPAPAKPVTSHRFLDEAGDTTFYGKGKVPIIGQAGVSLSFAIGMLKFKVTGQLAERGSRNAGRGSFNAASVCARLVEPVRGVGMIRETLDEREVEAGKKPALTPPHILNLAERVHSERLFLPNPHLRDLER